MLSKQELGRYQRHFNLPDFGIESQEKLKKAKVLVVGAGGLGAPLLQYLTAVGIGTIGVVDFDIVDESNLHRQVLFGGNDVGKSKTKVAIQKLKSQNPFVNFIEFEEALDSNNALNIINEFDIIADGTDNFPTRYLVNDACVILGKVNVYASIFRYEGQISVFNYREEDGDRGPNFRDLFMEPPHPDSVPNCAEGGVLGVLPGIVGSMQAAEVIKIITGVGTPLSSKLLLIDVASNANRVFKIKKNPENQFRTSNANELKLIDYEEFCGIKKNNMSSEIKSITVNELGEKLKNKEDIQLIDVREKHEYEIAQIGGELMPLSEITQHIGKIREEGMVVVHCRSGARSADVIRYLQQNMDYDNLYNLEGGILAWSREIDPSIPTY